MSNQITIYEPDNSLKLGYFHIFQEIGGELLKNRWLTFQLFRRDLAALYRQSVMGFLWLFAMPLFTVGIFIFLNQSGIFSFGDIDVPYPLFAVFGMGIWQLFAVGVTACGNSIVNAGPMITKINFSKKSFVMAAMGQAFIVFLIQMVLVGLLFIYYGIMPSWGVVLVPIAILPLLFLTLGIGFLCAMLNSILRDVGNVIPVALSFIMYLSPVLFIKPDIGVLNVLMNYNPLYYMIAVPRELALTGQIAEAGGFVASTIISIIVLIMAILIFHLSETRLTERV